MLRRSLCVALGLLTTACLPPAADRAQGSLARRVVSGLDNPTHLVGIPGDDRLFVLEQAGLIRVFDPSGSERPLFLDITDRVRFDGGQSERGLLGLAFSPDFDTDGLFYVNYTNGSGTTVVARYRLVTGDPDRGDPDSEEILLTIAQPYANHNGGRIAFGPDGFLYVGSGDGGSANDPHDNGQRLDTLLGKILRMDVGGGYGSGYTVPGSNPFVGEEGLDLIWAFGLRNPWGLHFDSETGDLYIADVGQRTYEEIDVQPAASTGGENYGWRLKEGNTCFNPSSGCDPGTLTAPAHVYDHDEGRCSVTGGAVYRGALVPVLSGKYVFADYCSRQIWAMDTSPPWTVLEVTDVLRPDVGGISSISDVALDGLGELYIVARGSGALYLADSTSIGAPPPDRVIRAVPNPTEGSVTLTVTGGAGTVSLQIVDAQGRLVREHTVAVGDPWVWDGSDAGGNRAAAGPYWVRTAGGGTIARARITLLN